jgi:hypothetical protein
MPSTKPKIPVIALSPVKSSSMSARGHDPETNTLAIQFKGGSVYHYAGFSTAEYEAFQKAESAGKHFGKFIQGKFKTTKLGDIGKRS